MQTFGKFSTRHDLEYISEHYIYINEKNEDRTDILITKEEFEAIED